MLGFKELKFHITEHDRDSESEGRKEIRIQVNIMHPTTSQTENKLFLSYTVIAPQMVSEQRDAYTCNTKFGAQTMTITSVELRYR